MAAVDSAGTALTKADIQNKLKELRQLVLSDNVLKDFRTYDEYLLRFLYFKDFDVDLAFKVMQEYTNLMIKYPNWYPSLAFLDKIGCEPIKLKAFIHARDRCGRRIFVVEAGKTDPSKSTPIDEACSDEIWFETVMDDPETQSKGICVLMDIEHTSWKMVQWFSPSAMKVSAAKAELYPCKVLLYHIVGTSPLVSTIVKLAWPFLSENVKQNIMFHFDNWSSLHKYISPDVLPSKYGGTAPDFNFEELYKELIENKAVIAKKIAVDQQNINKARCKN